MFYRLTSNNVSFIEHVELPVVIDNDELITVTFEINFLDRCGNRRRPVQKKRTRRSQQTYARKLSETYKRTFQLQLLVITRKLGSATCLLKTG